MKDVKALYKRLKEHQVFEAKYPEYAMDDNKLHVLYVAPWLNGSGYYRMILPALTLNTSKTHVAIITDIQKWDFTRQFDEANHDINALLIDWADYVVLPAMLTDATYIIRNMSMFKRDLKFVMDMDISYHAMPQYHPDYRKITDKQREQLLLNLAGMDVVTAASEALKVQYQHLVKSLESESIPRFEYVPNFFSSYTYQEIPLHQKPTSNITRIGLVGNGSMHADFVLILGVLKNIQKIYGGKVELIFFGWNGKDPMGNYLLEELTCTIEKSVCFTDYFTRLHELALDIALLPLRDTSYNSTKSPVKYQEMAAAQVPVIASNVAPFKDIIKDGDNGFLADTGKEWHEKIVSLIEDPKLREQVVENADRYIWDFHAPSGEFKTAIKRVFI
ncbi:hypothetical protein GCM10009122_22660 [Fulvivirga kasyanovii]|uniref:Glycosyltransferase family 1 protein n=1 Tax=Fulvivirga kasyanovii TaxID=396812 RepID=A0ABW9RNP6_9BACT|nr:glycosyltransferase family 4 protein [Fulvivirga kasyanovii]MTI25748.1 glycosyltransferase family 1 protein [Fulvivirga kasyanovii]